MKFSYENGCFGWILRIFRIQSKPSKYASNPTCQNPILKTVEIIPNPVLTTVPVTLAATDVDRIDNYPQNRDRDSEATTLRQSITKSSTSLLKDLENSLASDELSDCMEQCISKFCCSYIPHDQKSKKIIDGFVKTYLANVEFYQDNIYNNLLLSLDLMSRMSKFQNQIKQFEFTPGIKLQIALHEFLQLLDRDDYDNIEDICSIIVTGLVDESNAARMLALMFDDLENDQDSSKVIKILKGLLEHKSQVFN